MRATPEPLPSNLGGGEIYPFFGIGTNKIPVLLTVFGLKNYKAPQIIIIENLYGLQYKIILWRKQDSH